MGSFLRWLQQAALMGIVVGIASMLTTVVVFGAFAFITLNYVNNYKNKL